MCDELMLDVRRLTPGDDEDDDDDGGDGEDKDDGHDELR